MKIDSRSGLIKLDALKVQKKEISSVSTSQAPSVSDRVDTKLSKALSDVISGISESMLSPGEVHSNISAKTVDRLLDETPIQKSSVSLSKEEILALAGDVSAKMLADPKKAVAAFSEISAARVVELSQ